MFVSLSVFCFVFCFFWLRWVFAFLGLFLAVESGGLLFAVLWGRVPAAASLVASTGSGPPAPAAAAPRLCGQAPEHTGLGAPWHVDSSWIGGQVCVSCIGRWLLNHWATRKILCMISSFITVYYWGTLFRFSHLAIRENSLHPAVGRTTKPRPACEALTEPSVTCPVSSHLPLPEPEGTPGPATHLGPRKEGRAEKLETPGLSSNPLPAHPSVEKREMGLVSVLSLSSGLLAGPSSQERWPENCLLSRLSA